MTIGPVQYLVVEFPGNEFSGDIAPALADLIESGLVRVIDLVFVMKDEEGNVSSFEFDQLDELAPFADLDGEAGGMLSEGDILDIAEDLAPNSSAALLVWEDVWAAPFAAAVRGANGQIVAGGRIPHDLVVDALEALATEA
jgi:uncharacterized membrane protein